MRATICCVRACVLSLAAATQVQEQLDHARIVTYRHISSHIVTYVRTQVQEQLDHAQQLHAPGSAAAAAAIQSGE